MIKRDNRNNTRSGETQPSSDTAAIQMYARSDEVAVNSNWISAVKYIRRRRCLTLSRFEGTAPSVGARRRLNLSLRRYPAFSFRSRRRQSKEKRLFASDRTTGTPSRPERRWRERGTVVRIIGETSEISLTVDRPRPEGIASSSGARTRAKTNQK